MSVNTTGEDGAAYGHNTRLNGEDGYDASRRGEHTSRLETRLDADAAKGPAADGGQQGVGWLAARRDGSVAQMEGEVDASKLERAGAAASYAEPENEIDRLRKNRLAQLKSRAAARQSWVALGHGKYVELESEASFLQANASGLHARLVCAIVPEGSLDGQLLAGHMRALAAVHVETYFCWLRAEGAPMMMQMVDLLRLPALLLCAEGKVVHTLYGVDRSFTTEGVAYELGQHKVVEFEEGVCYEAAAAGSAGCTTATAARADARRRAASDDDDDSDELSE